jgi:hypothetical protein
LRGRPRLDYDTKNTTPTSSNSSTLFPADRYSYCTSGSPAYLQPIVPLSYDWSSLKTVIDNINMQIRWYSNAFQIDARQKKLCDNAKAANITIYTVQVNAGGDAMSGVLQYCASSTDKFYLITSASQTVSMFKDIGTSLSKLRVAR